MESRKILLLPGDDIGVEIMAEVRKFIAGMTDELGLGFVYVKKVLSAALPMMLTAGRFLRRICVMPLRGADAVLFGAVGGGPQWDDVPYDLRPEADLLRLRRDLELFANLRPACYPALASASSLRPELADELDILIVRELTGDVYFGEPKEIIDLGYGQKRAVDTQIYETYEIERIAGVAFEVTRTRQQHVTSMEKRNVMKPGLLWHEVVEAHPCRAHYQDVTLGHMLADAGGMELVWAPKQFDVIVTDNLFGDLLSDVAAMLTDSLDMLPSASLGRQNDRTGKRRGHV